MTNPYVVFNLFCVFIADGVRVCVGLGEGSNFQLEGLKIEFFKQKDQFHPNLC